MQDAPTSIETSLNVAAGSVVKESCLSRLCARTTRILWCTFWNVCEHQQIGWNVQKSANTLSPYIGFRRATALLSTNAVLRVLLVFLGKSSPNKELDLRLTVLVLHGDSLSLQHELKVSILCVYCVLTDWLVNQMQQQNTPFCSAVCFAFVFCDIHCLDTFAKCSLYPEHFSHDATLFFKFLFCFLFEATKGTIFADMSNFIHINQYHFSNCFCMQLIRSVLFMQQGQTKKSQFC